MQQKKLDEIIQQSFRGRIARGIFHGDNLHTGRTPFHQPELALIRELSHYSYKLIDKFHMQYISNLGG